ncbi:MAG: dephospho-CoA kinase [Pseudomonadota bacterium]
MIVLGLTGSIGMGKSTTKDFFADAGVPCWDADAAVHRLYSADGDGSVALEAILPQAVGPDGVDRTALRAAVIADRGLLPKIEAAIHPLVAADRAAFLDRVKTDGTEVVLCDVPLLFETGVERQFDRIIVVSAPHQVQRDRVLARPGMTEEAFNRILEKQLPDAQKRERADDVIDTSGSLAQTREQVMAILRDLRVSGDDRHA